MEPGPYGARLVETLRNATPAQIAEGAAWYPNTRQWCQEIADLTGLPIEGVAGAVAALSPRCQWQQNQRWALRLIQAFKAGEAEPPAVSTVTNRYKAWNCLRRDPYQELTSRKVRAFWRAILGDQDAAPIDCWAMAAACGYRRPDRGRISTQEYRDAEQGYRYAARTLGLPASAAQAICWVVVRGTGA